MVLKQFSDDIRYKVSSAAINLGVKGITPFYNGFSLSGRVGVSSWDTKFKVTDSSSPSYVLKADDLGNYIYYGVGMNYQLNKNLT